MKQNSFLLAKKLYIVFVMLVCLWYSSVSIFAEEFDGNHRGTISMVIATDEGQNPIEGAAFAVYRVADCYFDNGVLRYMWVDEMAKAGLDLATVDKVETARMASDFVPKTSLKPLIGKTDKEGKISFKDLGVGLYLVMQTNDVEGVSRIEPFFVAVGQINDGRIVYDVNATPKVSVEIYYDLKVQKIWNDDGTNRPANIEVALKKNGQVVQNVVLSEANHWAYSWKDLARGDSWDVEEINVPAGYQASYRKDGMNFIIENTPALIKTGQDKWQVSLLTCIGMAFLIVGISLKMKKDEE